MNATQMSDLSEPRLAIRVASLCDHRYVLMTTKERVENGLPSTRGEMIAYLVINAQ